MKRISLYIMAALYIAAGINHFVHPQTYLKIMPHFLPWPGFLNYLVGVLEVLLGLLLLPNSTRNMAAWGLVILLILIFPANIQMAIDYREEGNALLWAAYLRLLLQPVLMLWAALYTDWYRSYKIRQFQG